MINGDVSVNAAVLRHTTVTNIIHEDYSILDRNNPVFYQKKNAQNGRRMKQSDLNLRVPNSHPTWLCEDLDTIAETKHVSIWSEMIQKFSIKELLSMRSCW